MNHHKWKRDEADHFRETEAIQEEIVEIGQASDGPDSQEKQAKIGKQKGTETGQQGMGQNLGNLEYSLIFDHIFWLNISFDI